MAANAPDLALRPESRPLPADSQGPHRPLAAMAQPAQVPEGASHWLCRSVLAPLYGATRRAPLRSRIRSLVLRLERGPVYTLTLRELFRRHHGLEVGLYSIGPCEVGPAHYEPGTRVGRYSSIYYTVRVFTRTTPTDTLVPDRLLREAMGKPIPGPGPGSEPAHLEIGNDVFIGHNSIILPSTVRIGDGAVIGAGSVVQQPIPPYAVVTGNPARVVRFRFSDAKIKELLESKWWLRSIDDLAGEIEEFQRPLEGDGPIR